ncbi:protein moonraker isoform x1 [Limosa lapponica baueri]|uniref:Protein moonraker isoform x1 n=1 Tax=Limosa lapponica baueri TaxID=1758121 RepID=A0A2I0U475_LIMLA|nr:protein moonraker isoform x1 [Limosa lapponica baueri]
MGPSKQAVSDATLAFTTPLYRNEAKALQAQLQFNRNVPAVPENLALRFSSPRPIIIEKLKASNDQRNQPGSGDPSIRSSSMFSVISEERLKLAVQLAKRDIKRRHLEEQVKQQMVGDAVNKPLSAQKSQQQKTEVFENKNALKSQTHLKYQQKLSQPSKVGTTTSGTKVYLYTATEGKLIPAGLGSSPTRDTGPDPKPNANKKGDKNVQEVRRLQKELRSYVQKIEELTKKGREREILDPDKEQQVCTRREKQAARSARMLYVLQQQVKEIQDDLEKLTPNKIKHTKKSRAVSRLAAAHRGAVRALQVFANQFMDQTEQQIPTHYKELGSLIRQLSLCSAKLEVDSSISDIIIDILLQVEDLDSLLDKKQTPKKVKKCISASQGKSPRNTEEFPARKQLTSPKGEKKALIIKGRLGQECKKPPSARNLLTAVQQANSCAHISHNKFREENYPPTPERNVALQGSMDALARAGALRKGRILESSPFKKKGVLLPAKSQVAANADTLSENLLDDLLEDAAQELWGMEQRERPQTQALPAADTHTLESMWQRMEEIERHQEAVRRRFTQIVYSDAECWAQGDKMEQQMASIAKRPTSPHPIQITKFNGRTESEMEIVFEKLSDGKDIDENKEAEEKLQTGNDILQPLTRNSLHKECCVSLSVPKCMLQSILDYNSRYEHHLKLISHEAVGSFNPWQIAESLAEQLAEEALCAVAAELQDVCEDYAEAVFTSEFLQPAQ